MKKPKAGAYWTTNAAGYFLVIIDHDGNEYAFAPMFTPSEDQKRSIENVVAPHPHMMERRG